MWYDEFDEMCNCINGLCILIKESLVVKGIE